MKNNKNYFLFLLLFSAAIFGQDFIFKNQNKVIGSTNPSFYGFGDSSKAGLIYSTEGFDQSTKIENKYGFANYFFEDKDFSLAVDANLLQISTLGFPIRQPICIIYTKRPFLKIGYLILLFLLVLVIVDWILIP